MLLILQMITRVEQTASGKGTDREVATATAPKGKEKVLYTIWFVYVAGLSLPFSFLQSAKPPHACGCRKAITCSSSKRS